MNSSQIITNIAQFQQCKRQEYLPITLVLKKINNKKKKTLQWLQLLDTSTQEITIYSNL